MSATRQLSGPGLTIGTVPSGFTAADFNITTGGGHVSLVYQGISTPFGFWTKTHFTSAEQADPAIGGAASDPDHDGLSNLEEYALGLNPIFNEHLNEPHPIVEAQSGAPGTPQYLALYMIVPQPGPADVMIVIEQSPKMAPGTWTPIATKAGNGAWAASNGGTVVVGTPLSGFVLVKIYSSDPIGSANPTGFIRVRFQIP